MNNFDLYKYINFILNQDISGNTLSPDEYDRLLKVHSIKHYYSLLEKYEVNKLIGNRIKRFKAEDTISLTAGVGALPEDFEYVSDMTSIFDEDKTAKVDLVTDEEFAVRIASSISMPSERHPIAKLTGEDSFLVLPDTIEEVTLYYLRTVEEPVFEYDYDANDNLIYEDVLSNELDFEDIDKLEVAYAILADRGINVRDANIVQYSQFIKEDKE